MANPAYWRIVQKPAAVHRGLDAPGERELPGPPEVARLVEAGRCRPTCRGRGSRCRTRSRTARDARAAASGPWPEGSPASGRGRDPSPPRRDGDGRPSLIRARPGASPISTVDPAADVDPLDGAGPRCPQLVLHLHRLHDEQPLTGRDRVADRDGDADDPSRDDGTDLDGPATAGSCSPRSRRLVRAARPGAASSTSSSKRQPSTTTSTRRRPSRSGGPSGVTMALRRRSPSLGPVIGVGPRVDGHGPTPGSAVSGRRRTRIRRVVIAATGRSAAARPSARHGLTGSSVRTDSPVDRGHRRRQRHGARRRVRRPARRRVPVVRDPVDRQVGRHRGTPDRRTSARWNGSVVWIPLTSTSSSARRSRSMAVARSGPTAISLAITGRSPAGSASPAPPPCRRGRPARPASTSDRPDRCRRESRDPGPRPRCAPRSRGASVSPPRPRRRTLADSGPPAAIQSCSATRSRSVTSSVTPCSTWSRALTSRNHGRRRVEQELRGRRVVQAGGGGGADRQLMERRDVRRSSVLAPALPR